jgi:hypothetical protein
VTLAIIGAVAALLAALAPALARWIKGRQDKAADPETDRQRRIDTAANDIATTPPGPAPVASANGLDDLDALERLRSQADCHRPE